MPVKEVGKDMSEKPQRVFVRKDTKFAARSMMVLRISLYSIYAKKICYPDVTLTMVAGRRKIPVQGKILIFDCRDKKFAN